jgi:hypothetical protein
MHKQEEGAPAGEVKHSLDAKSLAEKLRTNHAKEKLTQVD